MAELESAADFTDRLLKVTARHEKRTRQRLVMLGYVNARDRAVALDAARRVLEAFGVSVIELCKKGALEDHRPIHVGERACDIATDPNRLAALLEEET